MFALPPLPRFGGRVVSLNGLANYAFREPLRVFPLVHSVPPAAGELARVYVYGVLLNEQGEIFGLSSELLNFPVKYAG